MARWLSLLFISHSIILASAQHVHYQIPEIESFVASVTSEFSKWIHYHGPTGTASSGPHRTGAPYPTHTPSACSYWLENIKHQGVAAFNPDTTYQVYRNVKDFGAVGDGVADDTAAINAAISSGGRCAPGSCQSTTITPAIVYFPAGTYAISSSIIDYYYTQLIGNPNCMPTIRAFANFTGLGLIDGDPYQLGNAGNLPYGSTNVFWRQVRNFNIDMTLIPATSYLAGVHWPTAQATSLQNMFFNMSTATGTQHMGVFIESGSGGFMNDLSFFGGLYGLNLGNQQFTMRNLTISNAVTAINQLWDWGWTYSEISINNCGVGLNMSSGGTAAQSVGSVVFFDSSISNTPIGVATAFDSTSQPATAGSLILENVQLNNVPVAVQGPLGVALAGSTGATTIAGWGEGHSYTPNGPTAFEGPFTPNARPGSLVSGGRYYSRSKPQYANLPTSSFLSTRSAGAVGNGIHDDTIALQAVILEAALLGKVLFFDAGTYKVTRTLYVPHNSKLVGESYSVIMGSGSFFSNIKSPQPIVRVGLAGESGNVEWSDMIVSTQGATAGAILIEWNLVSPGTPSGMWDVHARIGGFAGSNLQLAECPTTPTTLTPPAPVNTACIAAYMTLHITKSASGLYIENQWLWTADHDVEDPDLTQITVYTGRGMLIESIAGTIWLVGTAVEHHALYQYQFANTQNIFGGQFQTETPYYQPNPNATLPFAPVASLNDPDFVASCAGATGNCADAWGMRILNSKSVLAYGAGFYSFFDNYSTTCSTVAAGETCQTHIVSVDSKSSVSFYNLNTIGTTCMIGIEDTTCYASYADNIAGFADTIALFRS